LAFGGNFYAIVDAAAAGVEVDPEQGPELIEAGRGVRGGVGDKDPPAHPPAERVPGRPRVIFAAPGRDGADARAAVSIHPGWLDRSPCGTGTSARMAQLHARGALALNTHFVHAAL